MTRAACRARSRVRMARAGETLQLLDGRDIELAPRCAGDRRRRAAPIGLAGVMGGQRHVDHRRRQPTCCSRSRSSRPEAIAGRARRHGLQTDASQRFERGVDPQGQAARHGARHALLLSTLRWRGRPGRRVSCDAARACRRAPAVLLRRARLRRSRAPNIADAACGAALAVAGHEGRGAPTDGWLVTPPSLALRHRDRGRPDRGSAAHRRLRRRAGSAPAPAAALRAPQPNP